MNKCKENSVFIRLAAKTINLNDFLEWFDINKNLSFDEIMEIIKNNKKVIENFIHYLFDYKNRLKTLQGVLNEKRFMTQDLSPFFNYFKRLGLEYELIGIIKNDIFKVNSYLENLKIEMKNCLKDEK